jgi:hypothetical protein
MEKFRKHGDYKDIYNCEDTDVVSNTEMSVSNVTAQDSNGSVHPRLNFRGM